MKRNLPAFKDISPIGNAQRHRGILLDEQNGHVLGGQQDRVVAGHVEGRGGPGPGQPRGGDGGRDGEELLHRPDEHADPGGHVPGRHRGLAG